MRGLLGGVRRQTEGEKARKRVAAGLQRFQAAAAGERMAALPHLIRALRPGDPGNGAAAQRHLDALALLISADDAARDALRDTLLQILAEKQWIHLFADGGVLSSEPFWSGLWRRIGQRLLPPLVEPQSLHDLLTSLFRRDDHLWLATLPDESWVALLDLLDIGSAAKSEAQGRIGRQILEALQVISYRIAAIGLEPELVRNHPAIERYESPFLMQSEEVRQYIRERHAAVAEKRAPALDDKHLLVLLDQCTEIVQKIRKQAERSGASITLTALLLRLTQNIARMRDLLRLLEPRPLHDLNVERVRLFKQLVRAVCTRHSLGEHWSQHVGLVALRVTGNAGKAGEQYITASRAEYFQLFRSATGAGLLVALAAAIKAQLGAEPHAPMGEALLYSLNYAWCFMLMSALHWTLATKQPAMTANRLAHGLDESGPRGIENLAELVVRTSRSQFIALLGNLAVVVPVALLLGYLFEQRYGVPLLSAERAQLLLAEVEPLAPRTWLWGALTGVWLFLCGLISGYYDNRAVYARIPQRVAQLRALRFFGEARRQKLANYIEHNMGAILGSLWFGVLLGSTGALGDILGLPIDTLHVTFSSANTVYAWSVLEPAPALLLPALAGIAVIGAMNLLVSFGLALVVAMRARGVEITAGGELLRELGRRLLRQPGAFLWPPRAVDA
jgi:site-specific recombinase